MRFYVSERPFGKSDIVVDEYNAFTIVNSEFWDFQIDIEPYTLFLLNFNYDSKECTGIQGLLNFSKSKPLEICLKIIKSGVLKVDGFSVDKDACGMRYKMNSKKCYFDNKAKIFAIGEVDSYNEVFEIGTGQFVKIKDGQISAIFIKLTL